MHTHGALRMSAHLIVHKNKAQRKERRRSMIRKRIIGRMILFSLMIGLTGCQKTQDNKTEETTAVTAAADPDAAEKNDGSDYVVGQGFRPPAGSHTDKNGNIVDREGNTFDREGKWQVPEGGRVDSQGRIYDKNGKPMGGGATVGSVG